MMGVLRPPKTASLAHTHEETRMTKVRHDIKIEGSTGNVFADLGFENADEELLKAKAAGRGPTPKKAPP
jgi:hypothetical protein